MRQDEFSDSRLWIKLGSLVCYLSGSDMGRFSLIIVFIFSVVLSAWQPIHYTSQHNVAKSQEKLLTFFYVTNPDCSLARIPVVKILKAPRYGKLVLKRTKEFPSQIMKDPSPPCNGRPVAGVVVIYTANKGYAGLDDVIVQRISSDGVKINRRFIMTVK